jgi:hypothetical protein
VVSHGGRIIDIDTDGFVYVDEDAADALQAHGFTRVSEKDADFEGDCPLPSKGIDDGIDRLKRGELFALLKEHGVGVSLPITNEELRTLAKDAIRQSSIDPEEDVMTGGS